jgi:hypothetical protein
MGGGSVLAIGWTGRDERALGMPSTGGSSSSATAGSASEASNTIGSSDRTSAVTNESSG